MGARSKLIADETSLPSASNIDDSGSSKTPTGGVANPSAEDVSSAAALTTSARIGSAIRPFDDDVDTCCRESRVDAGVESAAVAAAADITRDDDAETGRDAA